mmetsp:Transcript_12515/g.48086  ORF Transcript_12515/g.48086 Transcript_12515/m.48086 type:complete len:560 (-) Transcript_12515:337-2016(-)
MRGPSSWTPATTTAWPVCPASARRVCCDAGSNPRARPLRRRQATTTSVPGAAATTKRDETASIAPRPVGTVALGSPAASLSSTAAPEPAPSRMPGRASSGTSTCTTTHAAERTSSSAGRTALSPALAVSGASPRSSAGWVALSGELPGHASATALALAGRACRSTSRPPVDSIAGEVAVAGMDSPGQPTTRKPPPSASEEPQRSGCERRPGPSKRAPGWGPERAAKGSMESGTDADNESTALGAPPGPSADRPNTANPPVSALLAARWLGAATASQLPSRATAAPSAGPLKLLSEGRSSCDMGPPGPAALSVASEVAAEFPESQGLGPVDSAVALAAMASAIEGAASDCVDGVIRRGALRGAASADALGCLAQTTTVPRPPSSEGTPSASHCCDAARSGPVELTPACRSSSPLWVMFRAMCRSSGSTGAVDMTEEALGARTATVAALRSCTTVALTNAAGGAPAARAAVTESDGAMKLSCHADCPGPPSSCSATPSAPGSTCCKAASTSAAAASPVSVLLSAPEEFFKTNRASGPAPASVRPSVCTQTTTWAGWALEEK